MPTRTVGDQAVKTATGKTWREWCSILDRAGAKAMSHRDTVRWLYDGKRIKSSWWCQMVSVATARGKGGEHAPAHVLTGRQEDGGTLPSREALRGDRARAYAAAVESGARSDRRPSFMTRSAPVAVSIADARPAPVTTSHPRRRVRRGPRLHAVRVSRALRDRVGEGGRGVVVAVQRRACHLAVDGGALLVLSRPGVPLAPNALTLDVEPHFTREDRGFRVGQAVALGARPPGDRDVDWRVTFEAAATWEPRPRVHRVGLRVLADRLRLTRVAVIGEGAADSLLPLLWIPGPDTPGVGSGLARMAGPAVRRLRDAALDGDGVALTRAARALAGLGPGLTPSGDDLLAGFAAAWTLVGESLGAPAETRRRVTDALWSGAEGGASPLGRAWLEHACRGELWEPMTELVGALLSTEVRDPIAGVRAALAVGASSGTDWMVGFLLGASSTLDGTGASPPW